MTTPQERTRSLIYAGKLLREIAGDPTCDMDELRRQAKVILRHFPDLATIQDIAQDVSEECTFPFLAPCDFS